MRSFYNVFFRSRIDLAPLGVERREPQSDYFCTPKGARVIGWAGVDGIHFCFVRGFGDMVFAVSPMNGGEDCVHPVAESFRQFLELLMACGDSAALEQAWMWDEEQFSDFLRENPPTEEAKAVCLQLSQQLKLSPAAHPWKTIKELQSGFDPSRLHYSTEWKPQEQPENRPWEVRFGDSLWCQGSARSKPGREAHLGTEFAWSGHRWLLPSVYLCGKGVVADLLLRFEPDVFDAFLEKWGYVEGQPEPAFCMDDEMRIRLEHPASCGFSSALAVNGRRMEQTDCSSGIYVPGQPVSPEMEAVIKHYALDPAFGWTCYRLQFPWATARRPEIRSLRLMLEPLEAEIPGERFLICGAGDRIKLRCPDGSDCTLVVREYEQERLAECGLPGFCVSLGYTLEPECDTLSVVDPSPGDPPSLSCGLPEASGEPDCEAAAIGIIGGADGPTAIFLGGGGADPKLHYSLSSPRFAPAEQIEWLPVFHEKQAQPLMLYLYES